MEKAANGIGSGVTGSIIARFGEKGRKVVIAISAAALMACSGGGGDDHTVVAAEPTTPAPTVPTPSPDSTTTSPAPAPAPVPTPNTPLTLGSINCTATVIQHGGSTTCQVTADDPQGIASFRAETNGSALSVTQNGGTYSITIPAGLPAGTATGALTSQNHVVTVYAAGKKPDGTVEAEQSTNITVQVQCQGVWINEVQACSI